MSQHFDAVLTGRSLGVALAAARLSMTGQRVIIVEDTEYDSEDEVSNQQYDASQLDVFFGLEEGYALFDELKSLGVYDERLFTRSKELAQIVSPSYRIRLSDDRAIFEKDIELEFTGKKKEAVGSLMTLARKIKDEIPDLKKGGRYFSDTRSSQNLLTSTVAKGKKEGFSSDIDQMLCAVVGFNSYAVPTQISHEQSLVTLALSVDGIWRLNGGQRTLIERLYKTIESRGGVIKRRAEVNSLVTKDLKIAGVLLSSYDGVIYSPVIILGSRHQKLYKTLPEHVQDKSLAYDLLRVHTSHWRYSFDLHINTESLPQGMSENVVYIADPTLPLEEENYVMLRVHSPDPSATKEALSVLSVSVIVPCRQSLMDYNYLRKLSGRILRQVENIVPFIDFNVKRLIPDFRNGIQEIKNYYPEQRLSRIPESLQHYYVRGAKEKQSANALSVSTPHSNLFFCGRVIWPSLGSYGDALSGVEAARVILDQR